MENNSLYKAEHFIDKLVPYAVVFLLFIIITDFFFMEFYTKYELHFEIGDYIVVGIFLIDLIFKFNRVRKFNLFIKKYWIDIIAVFPFFLLFRVFDEVISLFRIGSEFSEGQRIIHTGVELEKITREGRLIGQLEEGGKLVRTEKFARIARPISKLPRLLKVIHFYEKPIKREHKKLNRALGHIEREIRNRKI
ncbi:ion transporter [Candidatus Woesearchaeota archaeon]|nr:ion transporter [Candidatus Woesearchaeota archaeon]